VDQAIVSRGADRGGPLAGTGVPGGTGHLGGMRDRLDRFGRPGIHDALPIVRQMAAALAPAHEVGVVHRDLKPPNVMLVPGRGGDRVVVTDFGLAKASQDESLTGKGVVMGTPDYMAPEQATGMKSSTATDVYASGPASFVGGRPPEGAGAQSGRPFRDRAGVRRDHRRLTEGQVSARAVGSR